MKAMCGGEAEGDERKRDVIGIGIGHLRAADLHAAGRKHLGEDRAQAPRREVAPPRLGMVVARGVPEDAVQAPCQPEYKNND
jgi:hypothetical protein